MLEACPKCVLEVCPVVYLFRELQNLQQIMPCPTHTIGRGKCTCTLSPADFPVEIRAEGLCKGCGHYIRGHHTESLKINVPEAKPPTVSVSAPSPAVNHFNPTFSPTMQSRRPTIGICLVCVWMTCTIDDFRKWCCCRPSSKC